MHFDLSREPDGAHLLPLAASSTNACCGAPPKLAVSAEFIYTPPSPKTIDLNGLITDVDGNAGNVVVVSTSFVQNPPKKGTITCVTNTNCRIFTFAPVATGFTGVTITFTLTDETGVSATAQKITICK
jgi:hypothetical protein